MEPPHRTQLHIATLYRRSKVIAVARNSVGSRSKGCGYSDQTIHAERAVVKRLGDLSQLRGCTLTVIRLNRKGDVLSSKPCHDCAIFLEKCKTQWGLLKVIHS